MSHFAVLVITANEPTDEILKSVLQPFHEYECTGVDDQFVVNVDITDEVLVGFAKATETRMKAPDGTLHSMFTSGGEWHPLFSQPDPERSEWDRNRRISFTPPGYEKIEVPSSEILTIEAWARDYYGGLICLGGRFYKHTNPNAQWDWWQVGGRYSGKLYAVKGAKACRGKDGLMGSHTSPDGVDIVRRGDLDFTRMKAMQEGNRRSWISDIQTKSGLTLGQVEVGLKAAALFHAEWVDLEEPRPRGAAYADWLAGKGETGALAAKVNAASFDPPDLGGKSIEEWIAAAPALTTWAVVRDGIWSEKGSMGWFGMSSDNKDEADWQREVSEMIGSLPADHWIAVVDCHI